MVLNGSRGVLLRFFVVWRCGGMRGEKRAVFSFALVCAGWKAGVWRFLTSVDRWAMVSQRVAVHFYAQNLCWWGGGHGAMRRAPAEQTKNRFTLGRAQTLLVTQNF
ncbi:unnamed protein product [Brugia timori]|uniref:Secreted protein n=1 Tax=Brugia timori TaxID=42155 RepID=A0A0R3Q572_9BILA|nr:unnamed protein product [Brugia timori]